MTVRIAAQFTKDTRIRNGLNPHTEHIVANRHQWRSYAVVELECVDVDEKRKDGWAPSPKVAITAVELVDGEQAKQVEAILIERFKDRTGESPQQVVYAEDEETGRIFEVKPRDRDVWLDPAANGGQPVEHEGATEDYADQIHTIRTELAAEDGKALCRHCGTTLTRQDGTDGWVDGEGWPAADGHAHEPAEANA